MPKSLQRPVVLLTGASSGIGYDVAPLLVRYGYTVYGAARRVEKIEELASEGVKALSLDVTDEASMEAAVQQIIDAEGRIDVLINNAGYGSYGAIEDVPIDEARRQFEVNLFGLARLTQLVLPHMRARGSGRILNISSMAGRITSPLGAWYHATKYALEAFSDALRMEVEEFGIDVVIIEPGGIKTPWGNGVYVAQAQRVAANMRKLYSPSSNLSEPKVISNAILRALEARRPKTRYLVGFGAKPSVFLHTVLPDRLFDKVARRIF
ncbi:MAG: oxidoreductase [Rothia mucilaginosa]|uniref:oxidoreductase n=1 Tax=Rothia mucilaginosa TaxID=43675 RepID=UPI0026F134BB|nr:oxidoreductase [Rothia mucilaginosa]MBS4941657.1 oxidoreductase [Rothia mucilaginosa]